MINARISKRFKEIEEKANTCANYESIQALVFDKLTIAELEEIIELCENGEKSESKEKRTDDIIKAGISRLEDARLQRRARRFFFED